MTGVLDTTSDRQCCFAAILLSRRMDPSGQHLVRDKKRKPVQRRPCAHTRWLLLFWLVSGLVCAVARLDASAPAGSIEHRPLDTRSGPGRGPMFTLIPPAETGVLTENDY